MGVKTTIVGRRAWLCLEGMSKFYDEFMAYEKDHEKLLTMRDHMREFFFVFGFVFPCVYCRLSYREFTDPLHPTNRHCDISKMISDKTPYSNPAELFVYHLHDRVNVKLRDQEREKYANDPNKLKEINTKWGRHMISFEQARKQGYPSADSLTFWNATIIFLALMMCDWRYEHAGMIHRFFWLLGSILSMSEKEHIKTLADLYMKTFLRHQNAWCVTMSLEERLDIVWAIKMAIFVEMHWDFGCTRKQFSQKCKDAIVGCGKT